MKNRLFILSNPLGQKIVEFSYPDQMILYKPFDYYYLVDLLQKRISLHERLQNTLILVITCKGASIELEYKPSLDYRIDTSSDHTTTKADYEDGTRKIAIRKG